MMKYQIVVFLEQNVKINRLDTANSSSLAVFLCFDSRLEKVILNFHPCLSHNLELAADIRRSSVNTYKQIY